MFSVHKAEFQYLILSYASKKKTPVGSSSIEKINFEVMHIIWRFPPIEFHEGEKILKKEENAQVWQHWPATLKTTVARLCLIYGPSSENYLRIYFEFERMQFWNFLRIFVRFWEKLHCFRSKPMSTTKLYINIGTWKVNPILVKGRKEFYR